MGNPAEYHFCLHGPRAVKLSAIWETDANTILFYGSRGELGAKDSALTTDARSQFAMQLANPNNAISSQQP